MERKTAFTIAALLSGCGSATVADGTFDTEDFGDELSTGSNSETEQTQSDTADSSADSGGDGDGDGDSDGDDDGDASDTAAGTGDGTFGDGDGVSGDGSSGDGDGGPGDGDDGGDGDSGGTGDGTAGGSGELRFPGDRCDPFVDWCIAGYDCAHETDNVQHWFECKLFEDPFPELTGEYGSGCSESQDWVCHTGLACVGATFFEPNVCINSASCCIDLCVYQDQCSNGTECYVMWWQADLEDYLDLHTGIGVCTIPLP